jgi:hypothetical protein
MTIPCATYNMIGAPSTELGTTANTTAPHATIRPARTVVTVRLGANLPSAGASPMRSSAGPSSRPNGSCDAAALTVQTAPSMEPPAPR